MRFLDQVLGDYAPLLRAEVVPANHGEFEVELNGELLFSALREGGFPDYEAMRPRLEQILGPPPAWR